MKRQGIAEPLHRDDQKNRGWRQQHLRGIAKASPELLLIRIATNLGKVVPYRGTEALALATLTLSRTQRGQGLKADTATSFLRTSRCHAATPYNGPAMQTAARRPSQGALPTSKAVIGQPQLGRKTILLVRSVRIAYPFLLFHPFKDPSIIPFTKCFCKNGYTHNIGAVTTISMAAFRLSGMITNPSSFSIIAIIAESSIKSLNTS